MSIRIENTVYPSTPQWQAAIRGMRNAKRSWDKSDTDDTGIGEADLKLMRSLVQAGSSHRKFLRMLPVITDDKQLLGVITRRQAMENLPNTQPREVYTVSDQIITNLQYDHGDYCLIVEPALVDSSGNIAQGVLVEALHAITNRKLTKKSPKNIIVEELSIHFLQVAQIDDILRIRPKVISEKRRSALLDFDICLDDQLIAKAMVTAKIN